MVAVQRCDSCASVDPYQPLPLVTARIGQDRGIFAALAKGQEGAELDSLVHTSQLPKGVLESFLDYACTQGMAVESSHGTYQATALTRMLLAPLFRDAVTHLSVL